MEGPDGERYPVLFISGPISGHSRTMTSPQRLPASLTPLDVALDALLNGLEPVAPVELPLAEALRCIAAEMPPLAALSAARHRRRRTAGLCAPAISSARPPIRRCRWRRRRSGSRPAMPCRRLATACSIPIPSTCPARLPQVLAEAIPGQGVRRAGSDIAAGSHVVAAGRRVLPRDLLIARAAGLERLSVRRPRLRIVNIPGGNADGGSDRGERARRRRRGRLVDGRGARCRIDRGGAR